jgi:hydroxypyruvate reductase
MQDHKLSAIQGSPEAFLRALFTHALTAVQPAVCLPPFLQVPSHTGRTIVIGAGKAAAAMAQTLEAWWHQHATGELSGLVITRYGHAVPCRSIEVLQAAHPVPDAAGMQAAQRMLTLVQNLQPDDLVICLLSGGGSALMSLPAHCLSLDEKREINRALLRSGANIQEMNCVRKHLSAIKGGRLALACLPAQVVTYLISDVAGDDPSVVASGPTLADSSTSAEALAVLARYAIAISPKLNAYLQTPESETPRLGDVRFAKNKHHIIATAQTALDAAARWAQAQGVEVQILSDRLEGEARQLGVVHAALAKQQAANRIAPSSPLLILSGGETTVTLKGKGRGGRNTEYLLSLAIALQSQSGISALAADTDGIDGSEDNAGAVCLPDSLQRAQNLHIDPQKILANNDAYGFFSALGNLVVTGPSLTNVNDFRAILIA